MAPRQLGGGSIPDLFVESLSLNQSTSQNQRLALQADGRQLFKIVMIVIW
jgi:hypothetical protein